jgi:hypothetical protein
MRLRRVAVPYLPGQRCSVAGCAAPAAVAVALVQHTADGAVIGEQDATCPFLCPAHRRENEAGRVGSGPGRRADDRYPYTNQHRLPGWVAYLPLSSAEPTGRRR